MNWYPGNIADAVNASKINNAIFVVYVEATNDLSKNLTKILDDVKIRKYLESKHFIAIKIQSGTEAYMQFAQIYQLVPLPSLFFIGKNGTPLQVVTGEVKSVDELEQKIQNVFQIAGITFSEFTTLPSTSSTQVNETQNFIANEINSNQPSTTLNEKKTEKEKKIESLGLENDNTINNNSNINTNTNNNNNINNNQEDEKNNKSIDEQIQRSKELIEKKRKEREEEEKEKERENEIRRRKEGQKLQDLKKWQEEQELKQLKEDRKKEKQQEAEARKRILKQIEEDRLERLQRFGQVGPQPTKSSNSNDEPTTSSSTTPQSPPTQSSTSSNHDSAKIQFKKPDGESETHVFKSSEPFSAVRTYVEDYILPGTGIRQFTLATTFPRKEFQNDDNDKTLAELNLVPSSVLLIIPIFKKSSPSTNIVSSASSGFIEFVSCVVWNIFTPIIGIFDYIKDLILNRNNASTGAQKRSNEENMSDHDAAKRRNLNLFIRDNSEPSTSSDRNTDRNKQTAYRRVGNSNIHRLNENQDSDDENNTWNGNSTQQQ